MSLINSLLNTFDPSKREERERKRYEHEKKIAQSLDKAARLKLARSPATQAEILYYLAQHDGEVAVRTAVAANDATPYQANKVIASDRNEDVRLALANRLVKLLPNLPQDKQSQLYAFTVEALEMLASDEVAKIRIALAHTLKNELHAPAHVINKLARDIEREVAEPILLHCMAVSDDVLLDILSNHPASWTIEAISQRRYVSPSVSDAVVEAHNEKAGLLLLGNKDAEISVSTFSKIVEKAKIFSGWQKPLAVRAFLPADIAKKLVEFADESVRSLIMKRTDIKGDVLNEISEKFRHDLSQLDQAEENRLSPEDRVRKLILEGTLKEDTLIDAIDKKERIFAIVVLAALARTSRSNMETIIGMAKAKPIVAICWRAKVSMRTCLRVQQELVKIHSKELIYAKGGTDYPLADTDMIWQLEFFGLK